MPTPDEAAALTVAEQPERRAIPGPGPGDSVTLAEVTRKVRELIDITDRIAATKAEAEDLEDAKKKLSTQLISYFERHGLDEGISVDGRKAFLHARTFAEYQERPAELGGGRYTARDAVEVLRSIGREYNITPPTVNGNTLGAILREYRDADEPVPDELAKMVELGAVFEVRIGAGSRRKRLT